MKARTCNSDTSAFSGVSAWHDIDWRRVEQNVRGMQIRIAKAVKEGNWRRVKTLQRPLTHIPNNPNKAGNPAKSRLPGFFFVLISPILHGISRYFLPVFLTVRQRE